MTDCFLQRFMRLYNVPLPRVNNLGPDNNPYLNGYTQDQLNMRRKVEVLKYSANKTSSQTNLLTRKERYALAMRGGFQRPNADLGSLNCPNDDYLPTPTSSCGVSGPVMYLKEDPNVPLYNYSITNTRSYSEYVPNDNTQWRVTAVVTDASFSNTTESTLFTMLIYREIEDYYTTYTITVPMGLDIEGVVDSSTTFDISLNSAKMIVYFNGNIVGTPITQTTNLGMQITNTSGNFTARQFIGNVSFLGIRLNTVYNYVYQFNFEFEVSSSTSLPSGSIVTIVGNMTPNTNMAIGCNVTTDSSAVNSGLSIQSV